MTDQTTVDVLALENQLCFAIVTAARNVVAVYRPILEPLGLTHPQYLVMLALWERDGTTVSELGERLSLDSGTLTPLLKRLEASGFVTRLRDAADERRVRITLTPAGRKLRLRAVDVPACMLTASECSIDELVALTRQLQDLRDRLKAAA